MFHIYEGFHLVDAYHNMRHQRKYHPEDSTKRAFKIALVALVTLVLWNMPAEWFGIQNLTVIQQRIIAIFAFATLMWVLEVVSSWATSVAIIVLMLLFCTDSGILPMVNEEEVGKLLSYKGVMATFADPVIMLFIGGFVLAIAATKTGLDAQLAKILLRPFGTRSEMVLLGFLLITGLFSMFVSNTATAAMMLTFLTPVFHQLPPEGKGRISLAMSIPIAANLGGMGTPIGTPPNTIALKYLNDPEGLNLGLGFGQWMMFMFPLVLVLLFIGGFVLAIAATKTGLDAQLAKVLLKPFGNRSENVLLGFLLITAFFSMFVSNTATAAMMLTFLTPVFKQLPPEGKGRIALALSIPVAANLGGMGTPIGTPPNAIAIKYLNDPEGLNLGLGFGQWMMFMVPLVIVLIFFGWWLLRTLFPFSQKTVELEIEGGMKKNAQTYIVIVTFLVTVALWVCEKWTGINSYTVAMIPFMVFSLTGVVDKRDLEQINWSVIWMVAGGFALGYGLNKSGLAENAVASIPFGEFSPLLILLLGGAICYALSNFISNSATAALLMPILAIVCGAMGDKLAPIGGTPTVLIGVAIAASSAMILPISTPPNALAFATGFVQQKDMAKMGIIMGGISMVLGFGLVYLMGTLHLI